MITSQVQCWRCYEMFPLEECTELDSLEYECSDCTQAMVLARYAIEVEIEHKRDRMLRESIAIALVVIAVMVILGYVLS